jgi:hypothetical protein
MSGAEGYDLDAADDADAAGRDVYASPRPMQSPRATALPRRALRQVPAAVGVFVVVLLSLQIFLLTVGVDALLAGEDRIAWITAACSVVLAAGSAAFYRSLR